MTAGLHLTDLPLTFKSSGEGVNEASPTNNIVKGLNPCVVESQLNGVGGVSKF